jgi:hypothetical protein
MTKQERINELKSQLAAKQVERHAAIRAGKNWGVLHREYCELERAFKDLAEGPGRRIVLSVRGAGAMSATAVRMNLPVSGPIH